MTDQTIPDTCSSKILVVDDSRPALMLICAQIKRAGFEVLGAETGEQALDLAFSRLPDLILLDINLPGISGFEVMEQLRQQPATARIPVIMISAATDLQSQLRGFACGVVDFVSKPTLEPVLMARVRLHLEMSRIRLELEQSEARYRMLAENTSDIIWSMDPHCWRYTYVSPSCSSLLGYLPEELLQEPIDAFLTPDCRQQVQRLVGDKLAEIAFGTCNDLTLAAEVEVCCKGGGTVWMEVNATVLTEADGRVTGLVGVLRDITARRQAEVALRELQSQLLQQEKMASIGQLAAGIAHEINNPMGFINSNLCTLVKYIEKFDRYLQAQDELLQQCAADEGRQEIAALRKTLKLDYVQRDIHALLDESLEGAQRVMKIVQDLKTFSHGDTGLMEPTDINACLDSTINIIWNQIKYVADLVRDYGELPRVTCNQQQLGQVFLNLLVNASHAIKAKGEQQGVVTVSTWADHEAIYAAVTDSGCGMPEELQRRIFEPFFTTKEVGKGTGLGLSISQEIIKKHGGELSVKSTPGSGTTFTVRLPLEAKSFNAG
jgi:PAS domain S-box-containing protein